MGWGCTDGISLGYGQEFEPSKIQISFAFRRPMFDKANGVYLGGLEGRLEYPAEQEGQEFLFRLTIGLEGLFKAQDKAITPLP